MRLWRRLRLLSDGRFIAVVYAVVAIIATWQKFATGHDNNLHIFRASLWNLLAGRNLYALHPAQHADYFKYSPTFALLMAPFAAMPEWLSAMGWNLCSVFALFSAVRFLNITRDQKSAVLWLVLIELLTSIQNFQSNALVAALIIATLVAFERDRPEVAAFCVALGASIKIFGGASAVFFLFYPRKLRFILASAAAVPLFLALPLLVSSPAQLRWQYTNWFGLLQADYLAEEKLSIMSWLHAWFGLDWPNNIVQAAGVCLSLLPLLLRSDRYHDSSFRLHSLASLLVFLVIFNHKAESPMFILAVMGVAIWFVTSERNLFHTIVMAFVLLFASLASTDIVPRFWRETITTPLVVKAVPCILAWFVMEAELLLARAAPRVPPVGRRDILPGG